MSRQRADGISARIGYGLVVISGTIAIAAVGLPDTGVVGATVATWLTFCMVLYALTDWER